jgi:hypothetical protein
MIDNHDEGSKDPENVENIENNLNVENTVEGVENQTVGKRKPNNFRKYREHGSRCRYLKPRRRSTS